MSESDDSSRVTKRTAIRAVSGARVAKLLPNSACAIIAAGVLAALVLAPASSASTSPKALPPFAAQWLKTCRAEQPASLPGYTGNKWKGIAWEQTTNYTYKGGCGFTQANWDAHKRPGQPRYMSDASPAEQLWACYRIYRFYLRQSGSHRYAATVWDANRNILGWYGFTDAEWKAAHK